MECLFAKHTFIFKHLYSFHYFSNKQKHKKAKTIEEIDTSNITVDIITVKAAEIRKASKTKHYKPKHGHAQKLIYIPSALHRSTIYHEASQAISLKESKALVSHGGRPWVCQVTVSDSMGASSALVEDSSSCGFGGSSGNGGNIGRGGGSGGEGAKKKGAVDNVKQKKRKGNGVKGMPLFRWFRGALELACLPHILEKVDVIDENHGLLKSIVNNAWKEEEDVKMTDLAERQASILSTLAWNDANHPIPTVDRKWISPDLMTFRSRSAAIEHSSMMLERDKAIDRVLYGIGKRGDLLRPVKPTRKLSLEAGYFRFLRDGIWVVGQEEDWIQDRMVDYNNEEEEDEIVDTSTASIRDAPQDKVIDVDFFRDEKKEEHETIVSTTADNTKTKIEELKSCAPLLNTEICKNQDSERNCPNGSKQQKSLQVSSLIVKETNSNPAGNLCLDIEVVGEEPFLVRKPVKSDEVIPVESKLKGGVVEKVEKSEPNSQINESTAKFNSLEYFRINNNVKSKGNVCSDVELAEVECLTDVNETSSNPLPDDTSIKEDRTSSPTKDETNLVTDEDIETRKNVCFEVERAECTDLESSNGREINPTSSAQKSTKRIRKRKREYRLAPSTHWRLSQQQINLCHNAVKEHYDKVMYTVKAKALFSELADGFDVFRERGRGRYDMQPPAFELPEFSFLNDLKKAPWMPVVRKILGENVVLAHKGAFLSIPGSDTQVYHQDGPHLTQKYQRACHAINVFIPLVDLNEKNGPTEFCLGTHYLGYENFCKDMVDIPLNKAGSPVIFDYRLGHRGLGNMSSESRPVVYLTYTSASNEFRDSVNFSKKRYRKLGELIEKPMSREERVLKRMRER